MHKLGHYVQPTFSLSSSATGAGDATEGDAGDSTEGDAGDATEGEGVGEGDGDGAWGTRNTSLLLDVLES